MRADRALEVGDNPAGRPQVGLADAGPVSPAQAGRLWLPRESCACTNGRRAPGARPRPTAGRPWAYTTRRPGSPGAARGAGHHDDGGGKADQVMDLRAGGGRRRWTCQSSGIRPTIVLLRVAGVRTASAIHVVRDGRTRSWPATGFRRWSVGTPAGPGVTSRPGHVVPRTPPPVQACSDVAAQACGGGEHQCGDKPDEPGRHAVRSAGRQPAPHRPPPSRARLCRGSGAGRRSPGPRFRWGRGPRERGVPATRSGPRPRRRPTGTFASRPSTATFATTAAGGPPAINVALARTHFLGWAEPLGSRRCGSSAQGCEVGFHLPGGPPCTSSRRLRTPLAPARCDRPGGPTLCGVSQHPPSAKPSPAATVPPARAVATTSTPTLTPRYATTRSRRR